MITISRYTFNRQLIDRLSDDDRFPLTREMCRKNEYEKWHRPPMMQVTYEQENPENVLSIVIYVSPDGDESRVRIYSLEVESSHRSQFWGRRAIDRFKSDDKVEEISLCYLPDAKVFYDKMGFEESGENEMRWKRIRH